MGAPWEEYRTASAAPGPWSDYAAPAAVAEPNTPQPMTTGEFIAGLPITRVAMGAASPLIAAVQAGAHIGDKINEATGVEPVVSKYIDEKLKDYEGAKQRGMEKRGNGGFDWLGLAGSLVPSGAVAKGITKAIPAAQLLPVKMLAGGAAGAGTAAAQPVMDGEFWKGKAEQTATGAALGAAVPLAVQTVQAGKALVEPFYQKGQEAIIGRALQAASGGKEAEVAQALVNASELVPGSLPTVAQASQNAGIASLERAASAITPEATVAAQARAAAQNQARIDALRTVSQDDNAMVAAIQARKAASASSLDQLRQSSATVDPSRTVSLIDRMIESSPGRTQLTKALGDVKASLYTPDGQLRSNPSQLYQGARKNLTDLLNAKAGDGSKLNETISRQLTTVMKSLDHHINKAEPAYGQFMQTYAEKSKPINQLEIGQEILKKSVNPVGDVQLSPLTSSLSDKTAQRATGFKRATLEGTMTPPQLDTLNAVREDLVRAVQARNMASTAGSDTVRKLAYSNLIDRAGIPTFLREFAPTQAAGNLMARGADSVYGKANREIAAKLAETLMDPKEAARMMRMAGPSRYAAIVDELTKRGSAVGGTATGRFNE